MFRPEIKMNIPDENIQNWMQVLREGGFDDKEIDSILMHLNPTFRKIKAPELIKKELENVVNNFRAKRKREMNKDEIEYFRKGIEERFGLNK